MTDAEGPYALPEGWAWTTIGGAFVVESGGTPSTKNPTNFGGSIPWITPADLSGFEEKYISRGSRDITREGLESSSAKLLPKGTVVFSSRAPIGYVAIALNDLCTNQGCKNFIIPTGIFNEYVYYCLKGNKDLAESYASGTTFLELSAKRAAMIPFPLPPLPEQRRIVAKIEELFARLDAGVSALEKARAQLKRYRQSVLKAAVEGRLTEEWRRGHPDVEPSSVLLERIEREREKSGRGRGKKLRPLDASGLPELPKGWTWATVEQVADVATGATPLRKNSKYYEDGTVPWITSGALNNIFVTKASEMIAEIAIHETNAKIFPIHTLLVALYGEGKTRGKVSELLVEAATNQACAALMFDGAASLIRPYIKLFFQKNYEDIRRLSSGGVQPNLNLGIIKTTVVPLPPKEEQKEIVSEIERRLSVADKTEATLEASLKGAARLRQSILKKAFQGELVPQDPSDEPAAALLERIRAERGEARPAGGRGRGRRGRPRKDAAIQAELI